jgi:diguanylate cyclase (GGDEF)-like protein/PAS domain S-box-containing protein
MLEVPMSDPSARRFETLRGCCQAAAIAVVAISCVVLFGWAFQIAVLMSVFPGLVTMKANTAVGLALSAISLWLQVPGESRGPRRNIARFLAAIVVLLGAASLSEYAFGIDLRIDQLLFLDPKGSLGTSFPGRMAPTTATAFITIGLALMLLEWKTKRGQRPAQVLSLWTGLIAMMAICGYFYHATALSKIMLYTQIAVHTALGLVLMSAAVFFARPRDGIAGEITSEGSGSVMARGLLPAVLVIPILLGWLCSRGQVAGLYGWELGLAIYATATTLVFAVLVWQSARRMNVEYAQRSAAETGIRLMNATLEGRVEERTRALEQQTRELAQHAALLDLAHDAIIVRNMENRIVFWNRGAELMYGWPAGQAVGKIIFKLLKAEFTEPVENIEAQLLEQGYWDGEAIHETRDGSRINVGTRWALQRDANGAPFRILTINHDITERKQAEFQRLLLSERLTLATSAAKVGVWEWDLVSNSVVWDSTMFEIYGIPPEVPMPYEKWARTVHPGDLAAVETMLRKTIEDKSQSTMEFRITRADGSVRLICVIERVVFDRRANVSRVIGVNMDVTDRKEVEAALFEEQERAQVTLNSIGDAVICTDISGRITFLNLVAERMTGWAWQEAAGRPMAEVFRIIDAVSRETTPNPMELAVANDRVMNLPANCILLRRDGFEAPIEDSVAPIHDREGKATGAVIVFRDVSAARAMSLQMAHSAQHDFLTGLPNRMLFNDRVNQAIALAARHMKKVAVLFLDLDGFKHINDSLGHPIGDKLLQSIAQRLVNCVRGADTVSRQGGDEFVVLLSEVAQAEDAAITARRMLQAVAEAHGVDHHDLHVTTSIGLSIYPDDGLDAETLIKNADTAMYQAKENGRQSYQFFKPAMNVRAVERQSIEESLRRAVEREEFTLHYQPKISLATGEITGAEALIRWNHPTRGAVSPEQFIPVAEDCGLILPVGKWVLREACRQGRAWMDAGLPLRSVAVNISAMEFRQEEFLGGVFAVLEETGLDPSCLELELTESILMKNIESTEAILKALRARGAQVAVDDFGTGYSSLSYLRRFPIDALKIDQSFVRQITNAPDETSIVTAIISMGRNLKLRVVAEGVETQQELAFLQAHHGDEAQGYYFSRPVPAAEFAKFLETGIPETVITDALLTEAGTGVARQLELGRSSRSR